MHNAFLTKQDIAQRFGTTPGIASRLLLEKGVSPVDLGRGRGRGLRWYAPAVDAAMRQIHDEAQVKNPSKAHKPIRPASPGLVLGRSANELYAELTGVVKVQ